MTDLYYVNAMAAARACEAPPGYWLARRDKYSADFLEDLTKDWVTMQAATYDIPPRKRGPVDLGSLNQEQTCVLSRLIKHHEASFDATASGLTPPPPLRLMVYGQGGTGKSYILRAFCQYLDTHVPIDLDGNPVPYRCADDLVQVMAPTGVAALNVDGRTMHTSLGFPRKVGLSDKYPKEIELGKTKKEALQKSHAHFEYCFLDEGGMVGSSSLGIVDSRLNEIHMHTVDAAETDPVFGGKNFIWFGHHAQLPPVRDFGGPCYIPEDHSSDRVSDVHSAAGKTAYRALDQVVILREQRRQVIPEVGAEQKDAIKYQRFLKHVMNGNADVRDWTWLSHISKETQTKETFNADLEEDPTLEYKELFATNTGRQTRNLESLQRHSQKTGNPIAIIPAMNTGPPFAHVAESWKAGNLDNHLAVAIGAPVQLVHNEWLIAGLVNGATGVIHDILYPADSHGPPDIPEAILVRMDEFRGKSCLPEVDNVVKLIPIKNDFLVPKGKGKPGTCFRRQFGINLCFAKSIHKSQGATLDRGTVDLGDIEFQCGLSYVAFSRFKKPGHFYCDPMPTFKRLCPSSKAMEPRIRHERALENQFHEGIQRHLHKFKTTFHASLRGATPAAICPMIADAKKNNYTVRFLEAKRTRTGIGDRFDAYRTSTTISAALENGATLADLNSDFAKGIMVVDSPSCSAYKSSWDSLGDDDDEGGSSITLGQQARLDQISCILNDPLSCFLPWDWVPDTPPSAPGRRKKGKKQAGIGRWLAHRVALVNYPPESESFELNGRTGYAVAFDATEQTYTVHLTLSGRVVSDVRNNNIVGAQRRDGRALHIRGAFKRILRVYRAQIRIRKRRKERKMRERKRKRKEQLNGNAVDWTEEDETQTRLESARFEAAKKAVTEATDREAKRKAEFCDENSKSLALSRQYMADYLKGNANANKQTPQTDTNEHQCPPPHDKTNEDQGPPNDDGDTASGNDDSSIMGHHAAANWRRIYEEYQMPSFQSANFEAHEGIPNTSELHMALRLVDYGGLPHINALWDRLRKWLIAIGFDDVVIELATSTYPPNKQEGESCGIVAAKAVSWLHHASSSLESTPNFMTYPVQSAVHEDHITEANNYFIEKFQDHVVPLNFYDTVDTKFLGEVAVQNLVQHFENNEQLAIIEHPDAEVHRQKGEKFLRIVALDELVLMIARHVYIAAVEGKLICGPRFVISNTHVLGQPGFHWVTVVYDIQSAVEYGVRQLNEADVNDDGTNPGSVSMFARDLHPPAHQDVSLPQQRPPLNLLPRDLQQRAHQDGTRPQQGPPRNLDITQPTNTSHHSTIAKRRNEKQLQTTLQSFFSKQS